MVNIDPNPFVMRNGLITIGADSYQKAVSSAQLVPSSSTVTFQGLEPTATYTFPAGTTFTFDLEYGQDWSTEDSLSRMLWDAAVTGEPLTVSYTPNNPASGGKTTWEFEVFATAGAVGGAVNAVATATVSLGVVGWPEPTFDDGTP